MTTQALEPGERVIGEKSHRAGFPVEVGIVDAIRESERAECERLNAVPVVYPQRRVLESARALCALDDPAFDEAVRAKWRRLRVVDQPPAEPACTFCGNDDDFQGDTCGYCGGCRACGGLSRPVWLALALVHCTNIAPHVCICPEEE